MVISLFPLAFSTSISAQESNHLCSVAQSAAILNDAPSFSVGVAFFEHHPLAAYYTRNEVD